MKLSTIKVHKLIYSSFMWPDFNGFDFMHVFTMPSPLRVTVTFDNSAITSVIFGHFI